MVYILLIPFDVFATVRHYTSIFTLYNPVTAKNFEITIYDLYFACYLIMIYMCFVALPFSYFYA